jgi:Na+-driven multidrug efflux pump
MQATQQGIVRGLGHLKAASYIAFVSYYGFAIPLGYIFTFMIGNNGNGIGLPGLWYGMFSGQLVLVSLYQYFLTKQADWHLSSKNAQSRTERDEKLIGGPASSEMEDLKKKNEAINGP